eukprot:TRINITY_DN27321_c0_g1_i1.p1 TRINITY_DN27321_c0_g1~~TRINITY_DN27321_c0_g1_i1.p1  ORF type:complete len:125 (+),score=15.25 TRINITY_DN27321_c0_g1_i1:638-1012(+)
MEDTSMPPSPNPFAKATSLVTPCFCVKAFASSYSASVALAFSAKAVTVSAISTVPVASRLISLAVSATVPEVTKFCRSAAVVLELTGSEVKSSVTPPFRNSEVALPESTAFEKVSSAYCTSSST